MSESGLEPRQRRAFVVLNPVAGQSDPEEVRRILAAIFGAAGWAYDLHETAAEEGLAAVVREAVLEGCDLVVAAGGDGTIALVADHLIGTETPLGVLPLGTGNILSVELGIPQDLPGAAALLVGAHRVVALDAMRVGSRHYFLNAGVGLIALVMQDTPREAKTRFGMLAYALTGVEKLLEHRPSRFTLQVDGRRRRLRASVVVVANAGAVGSGGARWADGIRPDDGQLDLVIWRTGDLRSFLRLVWQLLTGLPNPGRQSSTTSYARAPP